MGSCNDHAGAWGLLATRQEGPGPAMRDGSVHQLRDVANVPVGAGDRLGTGFSSLHRVTRNVRLSLLICAEEDTARTLTQRPTREHSGHGPRGWRGQEAQRRRVSEHTGREDRVPSGRLLSPGRPESSLSTPVAQTGTQSCPLIWGSLSEVSASRHQPRS